MARIAAVPKPASIGVAHKRLQKARDAGMQIVKEAIISDDGQTKENRRRIEQPIDTACRLHWISPEMHAAGHQVLMLMGGARSEPRTTSSYLAAVDCASSGMSDCERRDLCAKRLRRAVASVPDVEFFVGCRIHVREVFFEWLEQGEVEDMDIYSLGRKLTLLKHSECIKQAGVMALQLCLGALALHFGYTQKSALLDATGPTQRHPSNKLASAEILLDARAG